MMVLDAPWRSSQRHHMRKSSNAEQEQLVDTAILRNDPSSPGLKLSRADRRSSRPSRGASRNWASPIGCDKGGGPWQKNNFAPPRRHTGRSISIASSVVFVYNDRISPDLTWIFRHGYASDHQSPSARPPGGLERREGLQGYRHSVQRDAAQC